MFSECEKWRIEFEVEHLKHTFVFEEREKVNQYYPQYYHKTDNVYTLQFLFSLILLPPLSTTLFHSILLYFLVLSLYISLYLSSRLLFTIFPRWLTVSFLGISMLTRMIVGSTIIFRTI